MGTTHESAVYTQEMGRFALIIVALGSGCSSWQPPGDGIAKGCHETAVSDQTLRQRTGISSHLEWADDAASTARREFEIAQWAELGIGLARTDFSWDLVEPERGVWDWSGPDRVMDAAESVNVQVLPILNYGNPWASSLGDDRHLPPDDLGDFGTYAAALAERYGGRLQRYEIWNEPNTGGTFWEPTDDPALYADLMVVAADALHEADPDGLVSSAGLFGPKLLVNMPAPEFTAEMMAERPDALNHVDAFGFHPYRYPFTSPETEDAVQESSVTSICGFETQLADAGHDLPLWNTEMGWHTAPDALVAGITPEQHAAFTIRSMVLNYAQGVQMYTIYTFRDSGDDLGDQEQNFGLYTWDADPLSGDDAEMKPAAAALKAFLQLAGDATEVSDRSVALGLDGNTYAYNLVGASSRTVVLWTDGDPVTVALGQTRGASVLDLFGQPIDVEVRRGAWQLPVSGDPIYVSIAY